MGKEVLEKAITDAKDNYHWSLYFFKINRREHGNPYLVYKIKFKKDDGLLKYANTLCDMVLKFQVEQLDSIQEYDGQNSKVSCDKISVESDLIAEQWNYFFDAVGNPTSDQTTGKYQGYILAGKPTKEIEAKEPIVFVRVGNPVAQLKSNRSVVFTCSPDNELEDITDDVCRLYLSADFIVLNKTLYTFSYKFETVFHMEKTMKKVKTDAIDKIIATDAFADNDQVSKMMKSYKSARTFLSLDDDRVGRLKDPTKRTFVANLLKLAVHDGEIQVQTESEATKLIKYLCYKIFQDKETDHIIEVSSVINSNVIVDTQT